MNRLDGQIKIIDDVICRHFNNIEIMSRGMVSQDILSQMRNLVEHLMLKFIYNGQDIDINYDNMLKSTKTSDLKFLDFDQFCDIETENDDNTKDKKWHIMCSIY